MAKTPHQNFVQKTWDDLAARRRRDAASERLRQQNPLAKQPEAGSEDRPKSFAEMLSPKVPSTPSPADVHKGRRKI